METNNFTKQKMELMQFHFIYISITSHENFHPHLYTLFYFCLNGFYFTFFISLFYRITSLLSVSDGCTQNLIYSFVSTSTMQVSCDTNQWIPDYTSFYFCISGFYFTFFYIELRHCFQSLMDVPRVLSVPLFQYLPCSSDTYQCMCKSHIKQKQHCNKQHCFLNIFFPKPP